LAIPATLTAYSIATTLLANRAGCGRGLALAIFDRLKRFEMLQIYASHWDTSE
jgi:hypothetical protein